MPMTELRRPLAEARAALRHAIHVIKDAGMEAMIEQEMCAIAPVVVMCRGHDDHSACHDCSRGMPEDLQEAPASEPVCAG